MVNVFDASAEQFSEMHWKSLRYFNYYRFCLALILLASSLFGSPGFSILGTGIGTFHPVLGTA